MKKQKRRGFYLKGILSAMAILLFMLAAGTAHAQDPNSDDVKNQKKQDDTKKGPLNAAQKKYLKEKRKKDKLAAKETKKALKEHMKHQTPEVRKRMKKDAKEAARNNEHKKGFFLTRWFRRSKST